MKNIYEQWDQKTNPSTTLLSNTYVNYFVGVSIVQSIPSSILQLPTSFVGKIFHINNEGSSTNNVSVMVTTRNGSLQHDIIPGDSAIFVYTGNGLWDEITNGDVLPNSITNTQLAQMAPNTVKGNAAGSTANAADLTGTQITALLDPFSTTLKGVVPPSGGGSVNFLRADNVWAPPVDTTSTTITTITPTTVASVSMAQHNTVKFAIQVEDQVTQHIQYLEITAVYQSTLLTISHTTSNVIYTGLSSLASFDVTASGGLINLVATSGSTNSTKYTILTTMIAL